MDDAPSDEVCIGTLSLLSRLGPKPTSSTSVCACSCSPTADTAGLTGPILPPPLFGLAVVAESEDVALAGGGETTEPGLVGDTGLRTPIRSLPRAMAARALANASTYTAGAGETLLELLPLRVPLARAGLGSAARRRAADEGA